MSNEIKFTDEEISWFYAGLPTNSSVMMRAIPREKLRELLDFRAQYAASAEAIIRLTEELEAMNARYEERGMAMRETGAIVRSIYVCAKCDKRFLIVGEPYCHCPETVKPRSTP